MLLRQIHVPGKFEDAYIYMGWLHLLGVDRQLTSVDLLKISYFIESKRKGSEGLPTYLFARNDWLSGGPFQEASKNGAIRQAIKKALGLVPKSVELDKTVLAEAHHHELSVESGSILDVHFYGKRMYVATTTGFFNADVDWGDEPAFERVQKRLDSRCMHVAAKFGAITASCGDEGIFVFLNELNLSTNSKIPPRIYRSHRSVRSGWAGYDLVTYGGGPVAIYYEGRHERAYTGRFAEINLITGLNEVGHDLIDRLGRDAGTVPRERIRFAFNSSGFLYFQDVDGNVHRAGFRLSESALGFRKAQRMQNVPPILSASPFRNGVVVESFNEVFLLHDVNMASSLLKKPVLSMRTYTASKRFQNLITLVSEEGVWVISAIDDELT